MPVPEGQMRCVIWGSTCKEAEESASPALRQGGRCSAVKTEPTGIT